MKELKIDFKTEGEKLPSNYHSLILSFMKASVEKFDPEVYREWFDKTQDPRTLRKSYTFSCYIRNARFEGGFVILPEKCFSLNLSTFDLRDLMVLYNAFYGTLHQTYPADGNCITSENLRTLYVPEIKSSSVIVKLDSALLVRSHDRELNRDRFLAFSDAQFPACLHNTVALALERDHLNLSLDGFAFRPVKPRKTVVDHFRMKVTANTGTYQLEGDPALLNYLLLSGLGSATGSGHGKFRVIA
ncbi:MAG: CRISPR-associated endoribonuclease Cas6 [Thermoguttaceae bacterium]|nr:CRISPR-associated endoribonuclease Cas6 [Thermoguttaceae bacterium]